MQLRKWLTSILQLLKPLTPHKLRHTLASELYEVTKDQVLVAQQLGQKGTTATDLYTHVDQKNKKRH